MGNRMICGIRRWPVEERLTRPQRLLRQPSDVDYKRLRKLILSHKLAPCFDAVDADDLVCRDLEECPICFLYFPSLNRSRCCAKGICTECFLQMKPSVAAHPAQCPFCKTPCYAVEYRGARTEEEKCLEQVEEQKFIEAKIRMQSESEHVCHAMPTDETQFSEVRYPISSLGEALNGLGDSRDIANARTPQMGESLEGDGYSSINMCSTRHEEFAVDLEGIMMMEAIWQSLQDTKLQNGSTDTVGSENEKQGSSNISPCSASSSEGECSLHGSLAECSIPRHQISEIECGRCSTHQRPHRVLFEESEPKCLASSYNSEAIDPGSNCSINFVSTVDSLLHVNGDRQRRSRYSSLVIREQPYMVDTESMA